MCEANVYLKENNKEKLIMEAVDKVIPKTGEVFLESIFGQRKTVRGIIKEMALLDHKIILERE